MPRPTKWRRIDHIPKVHTFVPAGGEGPRQENVLKLEELEALRLKDMEGLEQEECAERMEVSRPTFQRILIEARAKVADSLVSGKAIRIEGGSYTLNICPVLCLDCGYEWQESFENMTAVRGGSLACPQCRSTRLACGRGNRGRCRGNCRRRGADG